MVKIYQQYEDNDCGISVLQSLIHNHYGINISREKIYEKSKISNEGISIFDLEKAAENFGIKLESYELTFEEFKEIKSKELFVVVLNIKGKSHYSIAKKTRNRVTLFDSINHKTTLSLEVFKNLYLNVFITVEYLEKSVGVQSEINKKISFLNYWQILFFLLLNIVSFSFLCLSFYINKLFFTDVMAFADFANLAKIIFISALLFLSWTITDFYKEVLKLRRHTSYQERLYGCLLEKIKNKKNFFYQKFGKNSVLYLGRHIFNISNFCSTHIHELIASVFIIVVLSGYAVFLNSWFISIIFISILFQILYSLSQNSVRLAILPKLIDNSNHIQRHFFSLNNFFKKEWNLAKLNHISDTLEKRVKEDLKLEKAITEQKVLFEKINFLIFNITNLIIYSLGAWWQINKEIKLEEIFVLSVAYFYINKEFAKAIGCFLKYADYKNSINNYRNWISVCNIEEKEKMDWFLPQTIELRGANYHNGRKQLFKNLNLTISRSTFIHGASGTGKSALYKLISNKIDQEGSVYFDGIKTDNLDETTFNKQLIYQISEGECCEINWNVIFEKLNNQQKRDVCCLAEKFDVTIGNLNSLDDFSSGQKQFFQLINLINAEGRIILLDEASCHINKKLREELWKFLTPIIERKNFVVCSEHDNRIFNYFANTIDLSSEINLCL